MQKRINVAIAVAIILATVLSACGGAATTAAPQATAVPVSNVKELTIIWAEWDPANYLQQLGNEYEKQTGVKVTVVQEPWGTFGDRFGTEMAGQGTSFDMVVGDSQWVGQGATLGWYVDLTSHWDELNGKAYSPASVTAYAEYPKGSGQYWAVPTEGDADGWSYRKDLFEDSAEKDAFKAKYGYDLDVPKTWMELRDIAEFFTRPDKNLYGLSIYTQKDYDALSMGFENVLFSWGGAWGDYSTYKVDGVLNNATGVEALEFYKSLYAFVPPGSSNDFWQESINHYVGGEVAMAMNYFAFFPGLANEATNPYAKSTGFFANPAGPTGIRGAALGGQGLSIVKYISAERQAAAMEFLKWFGKDESQQLWADLGGYTCNLAVLQSEKFLNNTPYNVAFAESMTFMQDYWAVPVYGEMMANNQLYLHEYVVEDQGTAQDALDKIAQSHEDTLKKAGLLK